jgi:hypothetical protein
MSATTTGAPLLLWQRAVSMLSADAGEGTSEALGMREGEAVVGGEAEGEGVPSC